MAAAAGLGPSLMLDLRRGILASLDATTADTACGGGCWLLRCCLAGRCAFSLLSFCLFSSNKAAPLFLMLAAAAAGSSGIDGFLLALAAFILNIWYALDGLDLLAATCRRTAGRESK